MNELWTFDDTSAYTAEESFPNLVNPNRMFSTAYVNMKFTRQDLGIIYRLSLPVTIFLIIVGLSFWADIDKRIDVTLQMLLVVAALYLIVGQVIPFVGYLTTMDMFITVTFVMLSFTVGIHFLTLVMDRKKDKYPLNGFYRDALVYFFKAVWIPMALLLFVCMFHITIPALLFVMYSACVAAFIDAYMHIPYLQRSWKVAVINLRLKVSRVNRGNVLNKISLAHTRASEGDVEEEQQDEIKYGKNVRVTQFEHYIYSITLAHYPGEPLGFNPATGTVEKEVKEEDADIKATVDLSEALRSKSVYAANSLATEAGAMGRASVVSIRLLLVPVLAMLRNQYC